MVRNFDMLVTLFMSLKDYHTLHLPICRSYNVLPLFKHLQRRLGLLLDLHERIVPNRQSEREFSPLTYPLPLHKVDDESSRFGGIAGLITMEGWDQVGTHLLHCRIFAPIGAQRPLVLLRFGDVAYEVPRIDDQGFDVLYPFGFQLGYEGFQELCWIVSVGWFLFFV